MEEKIITGHKNGMLVLLLELVLYIAAVVFLIVGINAGFLPLVVLCVILLLLGWIPLCGLRVLKPQEALGLTLLALVLNVLSAMGTVTMGNVLFAVLIVVSSPMVCSGYWALSLFLWACLLIVSHSLLRKNFN